ncbi:MAG TPA: hypothetical protein VFN87_14595 [Solirubrobacteraceae bacterium]|nr:hypothetical protein [Solirubrobacteraceae bacterium]
MPSGKRTSNESRPSSAALFVRYGIPAIMVLAGIGLLIFSPGGFGTEGFSMAVGGGLSVLMLNWLFRLGVSGDRERQQEEEARAYFDRHGRWPDED